MYQRDDRKGVSECVPPRNRVSPGLRNEAGCRVTWRWEISSIFSIPQIAIAASNSVCSRFKRYDTESSPPTPRAKKIGFPIPTAEAPRAVRVRESKCSEKVKQYNSFEFHSSHSWHFTKQTKTMVRNPGSLQALFVCTRAHTKHADSHAPNAFKTSVPRRIPPSIQIGTVPLTTFATSGKTSMAERHPSNCLPP